MKHSCSNINYPILIVKLHSLVAFEFSDYGFCRARLTQGVDVVTESQLANPGHIVCMSLPIQVSVELHRIPCGMENIEASSRVVVDN